MRRGYLFGVLCLALLWCAAPLVGADYARWELNGSFDAAAGGTALGAEAAAPEGAPVTAFETGDINGASAQVVRFTRGTFFRMTHGLGTNGGGAYLNNYTLIMDIMFPDRTPSGGWTSLFQTSESNSNDGDWFIRADGGIGISSKYAGNASDGVWHRLALVVDLSANLYTCFIDGAQVNQLTLADEDELVIDGRWSLGATAMILADNDQENSAGYLNSLQLRAYAMTAADVAALGGPAAVGIPVPAAAGTKTWTEDFAQADGAPEGWTVVAPTVTVESEKLALAALNGVEVGTVAGDAFGPIWFDTVTHIEFDLAFPGVTAAWPFDHGGVVFCGQSPVARYNGNSCYVIDFLARDGNAQLPGRFRLGKFTNGTEGGLIESAQTVMTYEGRWEIDITATDISFTFNGVRQFTFADTSFRGGYLAFCAFSSPATNKMTVDNIRVDVLPADCPMFTINKVNLTTGKGNSLAPLRIPFGANDTDPYEVTVTSSSPATIAPVNSPLTYAPGTSRTQFVEVTSTAPGEATLSVEVAGKDCSGVTLPAEVLGLFAFEEHFSYADGPVDGWYIASPTAEVASETLSLKRGPAGTDPFCWYAVKGVAVQVGKMEKVTCKIRFADIADASVGCHGGMVLAPAVTAGRVQGYMIDVIERASDNGYRIYKDNNAGVQLGGPRQPYVWDAGFHTWEVTFTPTGFTFKVDGGDDPGEANVTVNDLSYRGGYLAFWCYTGSDHAQNMFVDDISIEFGSTVCSTVAPSTAINRPVNPKTVFTVTAPFGANFNADYQLTVKSTLPDVAVPEGATGDSLVLTFPQGEALVQTFKAECLSPGTTEFQILAEGVTCPNAKATFTVREPGLTQFCDNFNQPDGAPAQWTPVLGNWQVANGKLTVACAPGENPRGETWIWAGSPAARIETDSIAMTVNLSQTTPDGVGRHGGMMVFASNPTNRWETSGYEIDWIDRAEDHGYRLLRADNGVHTVLGGPTFAAVELGATWQIVTEGENLRFYADDQLVFDVVDATYREGYVGLWTYCNTTAASYDLFAAGACPEPVAPTASFTADPTSGVYPLDVSFDASASADSDGTIVSYAWDFGDMTNGSGATTTHTYTAKGTYTVTLTVTDGDSLSATATATITITSAPPMAAFTADPLTGRAPLDVSFDASTSTDDGSIASYEWNFGDETNGTGVTATHTYATEGTYTVTLTVTDDDSYTSTATATIVVERGGTFFKRGDTNQDSKVDIADAICLLGHLFGLATDPCKEGVRRCFDSADANDDGAVDIADAIKVLGHLFAYATTGDLPEPFKACGLDPTEDSKDCVTFGPCAK